MFMTRRSLAAALFAAPLLSRARDSQAQQEGPFLRVSGRIAGAWPDGVARFDRSALEGPGWTGFSTTTPWHNGATRFDGIRMADLMKTAGAAGDTAVATALNDYETKIPISDFQRFNVILAMKKNGEYMPVRDKGPFFIVYPYDSDPQLKSQQYFSRSAW